MELQQLSCCGIFELMNLGDNYEWTQEAGEYDPATASYPRRSRREALAACKRGIRAELQTITPRGRLVFATTVAGMSIAQEALRSLRFTVDRRFTNGNTGNRITLWSKYVR